MADTLSGVPTSVLTQKFENAKRMAEGGDATAERDAGIMAAELRRRQETQAPRAPAVAPGGMADDSMIAQGMSGLNESLVGGLLGAPADIGAFIGNAPTRFSNTVNRGINAVAGTELQTDRPDLLQGDHVGGSDWWTKQMRKDIPVVGPMSVPPTERNQTARKVGEYAGTGLSFLTGLGAVGRAGQTGVKLFDDVTAATNKSLRTAPVATVGGELAASMAAVPGGAAGGELGSRAADAVGVDPATGEAIGQTLGEIIAGLGGAAALHGAGTVGRKMFNEPGVPGKTPSSAERYQAAERTGINPTPGLVGNANAAYLENTLAINPLLGGSVRRVQGAQTEGVSRLQREISDDLRSGTGAPSENKPYGAGVQVRSAATSGLERVRAELGDLTAREKTAMGGEAQGIRVDQAKNKIKDQRQGLTPRQNTLLDENLSDLEQMRTTPIDPALDAQLKTKLKTQTTALDARKKDLASIDAKISQGTATDQERRRARNLRLRIPDYEKSLKKTEGQIDDNLGVRVDQFDKWRREIGQGLPGQGNVDSTVKSGVYAGIKQDQRRAADKQGNLAEYGGAGAEKRRLVGSEPLETGGDVAFLEKLTGDVRGKTIKEPQDAWNYLNAKNAAGRLEAYKRNVSPEEFKTTMGNLLDVMAKPESETAVTAAGNTPSFSASKFLSQWNNLPQETKDMILSSGYLDDKMRDLEALSKALSARGKATNPSGTATTAITAKLLGDLQNPKSMMQTILALATNATVGRGFMTEPIARAIADQNPSFAEDLMTLFPRRAGTALSVDTDLSGE